MTSPREDETPTTSSDEQMKDLPVTEGDDEVRGGVSEIVVTKDTDSASVKL